MISAEEGRAREGLVTESLRKSAQILPKLEGKTKHCRELW